MLNTLTERPPAPDARAHGARHAYSAPALGAERHRAFEERFGVRLVIGYGLTESTFGFIHPLDETRDLESMGRPRRHPDPALPAEARLVVAGSAAQEGAAGFRDAAEGEAGEIWLRNPAVFSGYFRNDEATRDAVTPDGWLRTGDLARRDAAGNWTFIGRAKLVIRRRGENMSPGQIEAVLEEHPAVAEAGVVGVPAALGEEDVRAYVVLRPGETASAEDLAAHCGARLAAFKVPTQWRFIEKLPRTPTQRIAYHQLPRD
jgi:crotonobetaine/carnitine-CoA ligase